MKNEVKKPDKKAIAELDKKKKKALKLQTVIVKQDGKDSH